MLDDLLDGAMLKERNRLDCMESTNSWCAIVPESQQVLHAIGGNIGTCPNTMSPEETESASCLVQAKATLIGCDQRAFDSLQTCAMF